MSIPKTLYLVVFFFVLLAGQHASPGYTYNLSAESVLIEDGEAQKGTIDIKGDKYRIKREEESEYIILRHDKDVMWVVVPDEKIYVELPLDAKKTPKIQEKNTGEISREFIGSEEINGHPTNKYRITVKEGPKTETFYQWTATDLNFPIKTSAVDEEWSVEFKNIKQGVADKVFEVPQDYTKAKIILKPDQKEDSKKLQ